MKKLTSSQFKIEKNVPNPSNKQNGYPFGEMDVGDSFLVTDPRDILRVVSAVSYFGKRNNKKFSIRAEGESKRVWRTG